MKCKAGAELTLQENRIFNILLSSPTTMKKLQAGLPELTYRQMLQILQHLEDLGLIQVARVPNLRAEWTVYYGALKAAWLQSESLAHRAMIEMIVEALLPLRPIPYMQTQRLGGDIPDVGLEEAKPKTAIEVETGRKKMTPEEIVKWAMRVRERNQGLGYERTIVVVPNLAVRNHYSDPCSKQGLELVTIGRLLSYLKHDKCGAKHRKTTVAIQTRYAMKLTVRRTPTAYGYKRSTCMQRRIVFVGDFIQAFEFANSEVLRYHGAGLFEICGGCRIGSKDPIDHY